VAFRQEKPLAWVDDSGADATDFRVTAASGQSRKNFQRPVHFLALVTDKWPSKVPGIGL
jgi:hypothetical protein